MILMDDLQKYVVKSEQEFAKELIFRVGQHYAQVNYPETELSSTQLINEWKKHRSKVLSKLLLWYSCDNGVEATAKEEIFSGALRECAQLDLFKPHMKSFRVNKNLGIKGHEALHDLLKEFSKTDKKKSLFNDKEAVAQFEKFAKRFEEQKIRMAQARPRFQQDLYPTDEIDSVAFFEYVEKTLDDILAQCMEYEQAVSHAFGQHTIEVEPLNSQSLTQKQAEPQSQKRHTP